ncbi:MAG: hypothetical protein ACREPV_02330 [Lysobacter sp.]
MKRFTMTAMVLGLSLLTACATTPRDTATPQAADAGDDFGVLLMAHGGIDSWEREVADTLAPLQQEFPMEIAWGMADAASLQRSVDALEARGVERIGVVRLFVSGESWYERTGQILGIVPGAPERSEVPADAHAGHHGMSMEFWQLDTDAVFAMSRQGLSEAPEMGEVLVKRVKALSREPAREDLLVLAHGPADDAENRRWLADIDQRADAVRAALPLRRVKVMTLREDWPEEREAAVQAIRTFVERAADENGVAIVIPYRVQGFGPYEEVLEGLDYLSDGRGLVPHPHVTEWVRRQALELRDGGFENPDATSQASAG